jgi:hypothetical protein
MPNRSPSRWSRSLNDVLSISLVLWLIYLVECAAWVPETSFVFRSKLMWTWKPAASIFPVEKFRHNVFLANPLPGFGELVICAPLQSPEKSVASGNSQEQFCRVLDTKSARRQIRRCRRLVRPLYVNSYLLFCLAFGISPIIAWYWGLFACLSVLPAFFLLVANAAYTFHRIHRILSPTASGDRRDKLLALMLSPVGAIRAPAVLIKTAVAEFHPLAVAAAAMPHEEARRFTGRILRDLTFLVQGDEKGTSIEWRSAVWEWTLSEFGDPRSLVGPPIRKFHESISYCPRCEQEYVVAVGACADCPGVALKPF